MAGESDDKQNDLTAGGAGGATGSAGSGSGGAGDGDSGGATGSAPPSTPGGATGTAPGAGATGVAQDWRDRRMAKQAAQAHQLRSQLAERDRELAELRGRQAAGATGAADPGAGAGNVVDEAEFERRVAVEAQNRIAVDSFNNRCNALAEAGRKEFGESEFNSRIGGVAATVDRTDLQQVQQYNAFLSGVLEAAEDEGVAHEVLFELAGDVNEAARVMNMPYGKMVKHLTKLALERKAEGKIAESRRSGAADDRTTSRAPKPISPVGNRGGNKELIDPGDVSRADSLSTAEWMARRERQVQERGGGYKRRIAAAN